jgi:predicted metal-dependent hydrolase
MKLPFAKNDKLPKIVHLETFELPLHIYVEKRRNSRISILKDQINIRVPHFLDELNRSKEIERLLKWASKRIEQQKTANNIKIPVNYWVDRVIHFYDGEWTLNYEQLNDTGYVRLKVNSNERILSFIGNFMDKNESEINAYSKELILEFAKKYYHKNIFNTLMQINDETIKEKFKGLKLKYTSTRWGSCSSKRNINISVRLLLAPKPVLDYVLLHELVHLREMNHSTRYWNIVSQYMPNYLEQERWLKQNSRSCDF